MSEGLVVKLLYETVKIILMLIAPVLIAVVVTAIVINVLQTVTQIKDQALTFGPKILVALGVMVLFTPWYLNVLQDFTNRMFELIGGGMF